MSGAIMLLAATTLGVNYGWQELPDGGFEYIIRIEPEMLDEIRDGRDVTSYLPPNYRDAMHRFRITVGTDPLPHEGEPPPAAPQQSAPPVEHSAMHSPPVDDGNEPDAPVLTDASTGMPAGDQTEAADANDSAAVESDADSSVADKSAADASATNDGATADDGANAAPPPDRHSVNYRPDQSGADGSQGANDDPQGAVSPGDRLDVSQWLYYGGLFGLAASLAANVYLVWVAMSQRGRYRTLAANLQGA